MQKVKVKSLFLCFEHSERDDSNCEKAKKASMLYSCHYLTCIFAADLSTKQFCRAKAFASVNNTAKEIDADQTLYLLGYDYKSLDISVDGGAGTFTTYDNSSTFYITFNMMTPVFESAKVRQAMSAAFDRQSFLDTVYNRNVPAYGFVSPQIACGDSIYRNEDPEPVISLIDCVGDPKALLIEGLKDMNMDPDPSTITIKMLFAPQTELSTSVAQFIQDQFQTKLGINVEIVFADDYPSFYASRKNGDFDIISGGWLADYNDVSNLLGLFQSQSARNIGKWSNSQYDNLIAQGAVESNQVKRLRDYRLAEQILCVYDPALINTYYGDTHTFTYRHVKGLVIPMFGGYYSFKDAYIQGRDQSLFDLKQNLRFRFGDNIIEGNPLTTIQERHRKSRAKESMVGK